MRSEERGPGTKPALTQHSILPELIVVINWGCLLIPVIAAANHRRHSQGWHSTGPRLRRLPEFGDIQHHLPTGLGIGGKEWEKDRRILSAPRNGDQRFTNLRCRWELCGNDQVHKWTSRGRKRRVSVNNGKIGTLGEVYSNGRGTDVERIKPTKGLPTPMADVLLCF